MPIIGEAQAFWQAGQQGEAAANRQAAGLGGVTGFRLRVYIFGWAAAFRRDLSGNPSRKRS